MAAPACSLEPSSAHCTAGPLTDAGADVALNQQKGRSQRRSSQLSRRGPGRRARGTLVGRA